METGCKESFLFQFLRDLKFPFAPLLLPLLFFACFAIWRQGIRNQSGIQEELGDYLGEFKFPREFGDCLKSVSAIQCSVLAVSIYPRC